MGQDLADLAYSGGESKIWENLLMKYLNAPFVKKAKTAKITKFRVKF